MASHGSDTPTSPRAILHHTDTILCTFMHTTVPYSTLYIFFPQRKEHMSDSETAIAQFNLLFFVALSIFSDFSLIQYSGA